MRGPVPDNSDVLIIGGGPVGAACARELARAGRSVVVVEPGPTPGAAWRAAPGLLAPQTEAGRDPRLFDLAVAGRRYYEEAQEQLEEAFGGTIDLVLDGILQLARDAADAERLREHVAWQRAQGYPCEWWPAEEVARRWPLVGSCTGALHAPRDGTLDPVSLVEALTADARRHGVRFVRDRIHAIEIAGDRAVRAIGADSYHFGDVVLAAGAWTAGLAGLPRPLPVEPVRGQLVALPRPAGLPDIVVSGHAHYVLTRGDEVICGSTMERVGFDCEVTEEGIAHVLRHARALCPALEGLPRLRAWAGLRPLTPDTEPIIGPEPLVPNLWYATGHGRAGILLAGVTGAIVSRLMAGEPPGFDLEPLRPDRW
jgi:glycine oxidase